MKILNIENLEHFYGGVMEHPDCGEWYWQYITAVGADQFNTAYGLVIQMQRGGCSNNPYNYE